jgi:hypothetical protein
MAAKKDPESRKGSTPKDTGYTKPTMKAAGSYSKDAKIADIRTGPRTLADAADYSDGYPDTMQHHINRGRGK